MLYLQIKHSTQHEVHTCDSLAGLLCLRQPSRVRVQEESGPPEGTEYPEYPSGPELHLSHASAPCCGYRGIPQDEPRVALHATLHSAVSLWPGHWLLQGRPVLMPAHRPEGGPHRVQRVRHLNPNQEHDHPNSIQPHSVWL